MMMLMLMMMMMMMMLCKSRAQVRDLCVEINNFKLPVMQKTLIFTTFSARRKMAAEKRGQIKVFGRKITINYPEDPSSGSCWAVGSLQAQFEIWKSGAVIVWWRFGKTFQIFDFVSSIVSMPKISRAILNVTHIQAPYQ